LARSSLADVKKIGNVILYITNRTVAIIS